MDSKILEIRVTADILENGRGDLLLAFHAVEGKPEAPSFTINEGTGVLSRNATQNVVIGNIHPDVRQKLSNANKILVTEVGSQGIVNGYFANVRAMN
ncbi:MAG: hypothetical protein AB7U85_06390 [Alphaproteobacteria bacterium]